jgi:general secretion pathway protein G
MRLAKATSMKRDNERNKKRRVHSRRKRGVTLLEILVVVTIIAMITGGVAIAVMQGMERARLQLAKAETDNIRGSVTIFRLTNPSECPTPERLREEQILDEAKRNEDPWGNPYRITCTGSRIRVASNGPDGTPDNEDAIAIPKQRIDGN